MKKLRRTLLWITVIGAVNMVQLCALSAYLGVEPTWVMFNSHVGMILWVGLTGLLMAGLVLFPRLARRPGLLTMHLAGVLILIGAIMSSQVGMGILDSLDDSKHKRIYKAYMSLADGQRSKSVSDRKGQPFDELPFEIECEKVHMEYYPYKKDEFKLSVFVDGKVVKTGRMHGGKEKTTRETDSKRVRLKVGEPWKGLPLTDDVEIRLLKVEIQPPVKKPFLLLSLGDGHGHDPVELSPIEEGNEGRLSMHRMQWICTVASTYKAFWAVDPRDPRRGTIRRDEERGKFPAADINISAVTPNLMYAYTKELATQLGGEALLAYERLRYVPQADAEAETGKKSDGPLIVTFPPDVEEKVSALAEPGSRFVYAAGRGGMQFGRVKGILKVKVIDDPTPPPPDSPPDAPKRRKWVEDDGPDALPMAIIELLTPQGKVTAYTPATRAEMMAQGQDPDSSGMIAEYILPDNEGKRKNFQRPKITFEVRRGDERETKTITIRKARPSRAVSLGSLYASEEAWEKAGSPRIYAGDEPPHKEYLSDLVIRENGKVEARKTIEMNHPLHYGGYHIYQSDPDYDNLTFTRLTVKHDAGWAIVLAGMILLMAGTFLHFWFEPLWEAMRKGRPSSTGNDDEAANDAAPSPEEEAGE